MTRAFHLLLAASVSAGFFGGLARAQQMPTPRGSLDAITVLPSTPAPPPSTAPAGHPPMTGSAPPNASAIPGHPTRPQTAAGGALRVHINKGTDSVTPLANDPVRIDLFARGKILKTFHSTVGDKGVIELRELPLEVPFQSVITVTHGGAEQRFVGPPQHRYQPAVEFEMKIYETTAEKPAWTIGLRYIAVVPVRVEPATTDAPAGVYLQVAETIGLFNPLDRAWTGETIDGERRTLAVQLPANITDIQMGQGFAEAHAKVVNNTLLRPAPMPPGPTQYIFGYHIPVTDGQATLSFTAPADTTLFALYLPPDFRVDDAPGLDKSGSGGMQADERRQILKARTLKAGQVLNVKVSGIVPPKPPQTMPAAMTDQQSDLNLPLPAPVRPGR